MNTRNTAPDITQRLEEDGYGDSILNNESTMASKPFNGWLATISFFHYPASHIAVYRLRLQDTEGFSIKFISIANEDDDPTITLDTLYTISNINCLAMFLRRDDPCYSISRPDANLIIASELPHRTIQIKFNNEQWATTIHPIRPINR